MPHYSTSNSAACLADTEKSGELREDGLETTSPIDGRTVFKILESVCLPRGEANAGEDMLAELWDFSCSDLSSAQRTMISVGYIPYEKRRTSDEPPMSLYRPETHN